MLPIREDEIKILNLKDIVPNKTHKIDIFGDEIAGFIDGKAVMIQAIHKILNTERYKYPIYSWNYGIEFEDLIGKPKNYCKAVIPKRIEEALLQDDRINAVELFLFEDLKKNVLKVTFTAKTIFGDFEIGKEVII